jgi:hypothetical protein
VNANPSGSRTPSTGGRGRSKARRELATATGPTLGHARVDVRAALFGGTHRCDNGARGGTRHAKKACRGALIVRRAAQGRTGDPDPRHVSPHLASQPLLLANTSAPADAVRPDDHDRTALRVVTLLPTAEIAATRRELERNLCCTPRHEASDTELVQPSRRVSSTPAHGHPRGKGVLAA